MKHLYFFLFVFFNSILVLGQSARSGVKNDSVLTYHYHHKFESVLYTDIIKAQPFLDSLSLLSKESRFQKAKYYYLYDLGAYNFAEHHLATAQTNYEKAYELATANQWEKEAILSHIWLANLDFLQGDLTSAKTKYLEILSESTKLKFTDGIANAFYGLADLQEDKKSTLEFLIKVDSVYQAHDTISPILANAYGFIGRIYATSFDNKMLAKDYFLKALQISKETHYDSGIEYVTNELMSLGLDDDEFYNLYSYLNERLYHNTQKKDSIGMARNLLQLGKLELDFNKLDLAENHLLSALLYFNHLDDVISQNDCHLNLAKIEIKRKDPSSAHQHLEQIGTVGMSVKNSALIEHLINVQIEILVLKGDYKNALWQQQKLDSLKSIKTDHKNDEAFVEMERRFQTNKKVQEIALLTSQNMLAKEERKNQRNLFIGILIVILFITFSFFALYKNRQRVHRKLEELDAFKSQFYVNISHEFRTPLTLILGPIEKQLEDSNITTETRSELNLMKRNAERLLNLVNQLLNLSKLESGVLKLQVSEGDLSELLIALCSSFKYKATQQNIQFDVSIDPIGHVWFDRDIIEKVVINLLSNAFKYTPENGQVDFYAKVIDQRLMMSIENDGKTLMKSEIDSIFDRYYQTDPNNDGVGIGLAYVKHLLTLTHGKISVEQSSEAKLRFKIDVPVGKDAFHPEELSALSKSLGIEVPFETDDNGIKNESFNDSDLPLLLLVEDQIDIRNFIKSNLKNDYHILEACDGREGLDIAIKLVPDIIISDVMMPLMDGFEMTTLLKQDERTCHIPIVLLTAKTEELDEFKGLNTGADDYIVKPFRLKMLRTRLRNLLENRNKLRQRYSHELILKPKDVAITTLDTQFYEKIKIILDDKLTDPAFSISDFSKAIGMSRMQLHRKLKALTGQSATELLREQRLIMATTLIGKSDINIAEIGYMVGFNDHSYFTKCFKQAYGCSPSEYR